MGVEKMSRFFFTFSLTLYLTLCSATAVRRNMVDASLLTPSVQPHPGTNSINLACETSVHRDFCLQVLNSDPESQKSNLQQLTYIALQAASASSAAAAQFINQDLLSSNLDQMDPTIQQSLSDCGSNYETAVEEIDDAVSSIVGETVNSQQVVTWIRGALAAIDTCDASVKSGKGLAAKVAQKNREVRQLCNNALHILKVYSQNQIQ